MATVRSRGLVPKKKPSRARRLGSKSHKMSSTGTFLLGMCLVLTGSTFEGFGLVLQKRSHDRQVGVCVDFFMWLSVMTCSLPLSFDRRYRLWLCFGLLCDLFCACVLTAANLARTQRRNETKKACCCQRKDWFFGLVVYGVGNLMHLIR